MDDIDYFRIALKHFVKERGGQSNVALDAHLSEGYISQIIHGKRKNPSRRTLTNLALALKTTFVDMITLGKNLATGQGEIKPSEGEITDWEVMYKEMQSKLIVALEKLTAEHEENKRLRVEIAELKLKLQGTSSKLTSNVVVG